MSNIIGTPFEDWVTRQINVRQSALGRFSKIDPDALKYYTTKTPFLRLASSVNISANKPDKNGVNDQSVYYKLLEAGFTKNQIYNDNLAKNFILFGGAVSVGDKTVKLDGEKFTEAKFKGENAGLNYGRRNKEGDIGRSGNLLFEGAYGWGGISERGYVPMPGIESAQTTYYNNGALSKATVNIKCFSKAQFTLLDILYLRPGYTLLLEFGHSSFLDNFGQGATPSTFKTFPLDFLLNPSSYPGNSNQYQMYEKIRRERELYSGNYEAVYGKISNFKWSFNFDGTYSISINIIGLGDIIDSLKLNVTDPKKSSDSKNDNIPAISLYQYYIEVWGEEAGHEFFYALDRIRLIDYNDRVIAKIKSKRNSKGQLFTVGTFNDNTTKQLKSWTKGQYKKYIEEEEAASKLDESNSSMNPLLNDKDATRLNKKFYQIYQQFVTQNPEPGEEAIDFVPRVEGVKNGGFYINKTYNGESTVNGDGLALKSGYIKFAVLLKLIEDNCNLFSKVGNGNDTTKMVKFDFQYGDGTPSDDNYMLIIPPHLSANPQICLIPYTKAAIPGVIYFDESKNQRDLSDDNRLNKKLNKNTDFVKEDNPYAGRIANIMINLRFCATALKTATKDEEGSISVISYLKNILQGVNQSLGSINNFRVIANNDTGLITIYDESPIPNLVRDTSEYATFNIFGVKKGEAKISAVGQNTTGSFITNIGLDAEIPSNFATMISIGSQNSGTNLQGNATSFSSYNKGLIDRIIPQKLDSVESKKNKSTPSPLEEAMDIWTQKICGLQGSAYLPFNEVYTTSGNAGNGGGMYNFHPDTTRNFTENYTSYIKIVQGLASQKNKIPQPFFLPFNLNLEMEGLSGMKLFEKFRITDDILPPSYEKNSIDIIIKGINHSIDINSWKTTIDTISVPRFIEASKLAEERIEEQLDDTQQSAIEEAAKQEEASGKLQEYITTTAWSAAFISYVIKEAGVNFPYGGNHAIYAQKIREEGKGNPYPWVAKDPNKAEIKPGDIVVENRKAGPYKRWTTNPWTGASHGDIVIKVDREAGYVRVVGGNVGDTIKTKTRPIYKRNGRFKSPKNYFVVLSPRTKDRDAIVAAAKKENINFARRDENDKSVEDILYAYYQVAQLDAPPPGSQV